MKELLLLLIVSMTLVMGLPVTNKKKEPEPVISNTIIEYERYLREVVEALETDPEFRKKLDNASEDDIKSGRIADELEFVDHNVRSKLDDIKLREVERLRKLATKEFEFNNNIDLDPMHHKSKHLNTKTEGVFEVDDLRKLILQASEDIAKTDIERREEYKRYEMQKEYEKQQKLKELDEEKRKKYEEELKTSREKHNKHEKVHHPGNKAQLEDVWEKQDHMEKDDFDPKQFFSIHDSDSNNVWDETEVKALFVKELDKVYQSGVPEDDMRERAEEMERMREHVFRETDTNRDGLISYQEFLDQTKRQDFNKDPEWETVDQQPQYTHEEYLQFERKRKEEMDRLMAQGSIPPHPNMPNGYYPNQNDGYQIVQGQQQVPAGYPQQQVPQYQPNQHQQQAQYMNAQQQQQYQQQYQQQQQYVQHLPQYPNAQQQYAQHQNGQQPQYPPQQQQQHQQQPQQQQQKTPPSPQYQNPSPPASYQNGQQQNKNAQQHQPIQQHDQLPLQNQQLNEVQNNQQPPIVNQDQKAPIQQQQQNIPLTH